MKLQRAIISFFLIMVYTAGIAHDFVPHHEQEQREFCSDMGDKHSSHSQNGCDDLTCIVHGDHCDEGVIETLKCLLSDEHHQNEDTTNINDNHFPSTPPDLKFSIENKTKLTAVIVSVLKLKSVLDTKSTYRDFVLHQYEIPDLNLTFNKGPPSIS